MAGASSFNPFPVKTVPVATTSPHRRPPASLPASSALTNPFRRAAALQGIRGGAVLPSQRSASFRVRAVADDDEWGKDVPSVPPPSAATAVAEEEAGPAAAEGEIGELKKKLKELLYGTDSGLKASSETRAEIVELITQLEARNPTPAPTEALFLLNGKWILAYTSFVGLFPLLASNRVPQLVKVEVTDHRLGSVHGAELCAVRGAPCHHLRHHQRQVRRPQPQARPDQV